MTTADHIDEARKHIEAAAEEHGKDLDAVNRDLLLATTALARAQHRVTGLVREVAR